MDMWLCNVAIIGDSMLYFEVVQVISRAVIYICFRYLSVLIPAPDSDLVWVSLSGFNLRQEAKISDNFSEVEFL